MSHSKFSDITNLTNVKFYYPDNVAAKGATIFANYDKRPSGVTYGNNVPVVVEFYAYGGESGDVPLTLDPNEILSHTFLYTYDNQELNWGMGKNQNKLGYRNDDGVYGFDKRYRGALQFNSLYDQAEPVSPEASPGLNSITYYLSASSGAASSFSVYIRFGGLDKAKFPDPTTRDERADFKTARLNVTTVSRIDYSLHSNWQLPAQGRDNDYIFHHVLDDVNVRWRTSWDAGWANDYSGKSSYGFMKIKNLAAARYPAGTIKLQDFKINGGGNGIEIGGMASHYYGRPCALISKGGDQFNINAFWVEPGADGSPANYGLGIIPPMNFPMRSSSWRHFYTMTIGSEDKRHHIEKKDIIGQQPDGITVYVWNLKYLNDDIVAEFYDQVPGAVTEVWDNFGNYGSLKISFDSGWYPIFL